MGQKDYGEPWKVVEIEGATTADYIETRTRSGKHVMDDLAYDGGTVSEEHQRRAVSCVNALAGLDPEAVAEVVAAAENALGVMEHVSSLVPDVRTSEYIRDAEAPLRAALAKLKETGA